MSAQPEYSPLVRFLLKALDGMSKGVDAIENAARKTAGAMKQDVSSTKTKPTRTSSGTAQPSAAQAEQKTAAAEKRSVAIAKARALFFPDSSQVEPDRKNWAQTKSIISVLGAAAVGGMGGIFLYGIPFLFPALMLVAVPLFGIGMMVRGLGFALPKGSDLRQSMKRIGNRALGTATAIALAPMILVGIPAFAALHAGLTLTDSVFGRKPANDDRATDAPAQATPMTAPAKNWTATIGQSFAKAFSRKTKTEVAAPAPTADKTADKAPDLQG